MVEPIPFKRYSSTKHLHYPRFIQGMNATYIKVLGTICLVLTSWFSHALPYQPSKDDTVARWDMVQYSEPESSTVERLAWHFDRAQYPGMENLHLAQAAEILASHEPFEGKPEYAYFAARLYQHQHNFVQAQAILNQLLSSQPNNINALLLKSSVHLIQAQHDDALAACKKLIGIADIYLASACTFEVNSHQPEQLQKSYRRLSRLVNQFDLQKIQELPDDTRTQLVWMLQIAADMALRLDRPELAASWLEHVNVEEMPISYIALWADVQRELKQHSTILSRLGTIVNQASYKDDALLIRLAMAETALKRSATKQWASIAKERVALRIIRQDEYHAADLARYFLFVEPDGPNAPARALNWARVNYQHAKMPEDALLLAEANKRNNVKQGRL